MIWLLLLVLGRIYHPVAIDQMASVYHTHVEIVGMVTLVRAEDDGDKHFRVADEHGHFVVCEIIPAMPLAVPQVGQRVTVRGIRRFDDERFHRWYEVHPVEAWSVTP